MWFKISGESTRVVRNRRNVIEDKKVTELRDFPNVPVANTLGSQCRVLPKFKWLGS